MIAHAPSSITTTRWVIDPRRSSVEFAERVYEIRYVDTTPLASAAPGAVEGAG